VDGESVVLEFMFYDRTQGVVVVHQKNVLVMHRFFSEICIIYRQGEGNARTPPAGVTGFTKPVLAI
jgi:hypothetical protein